MGSTDESENHDSAADEGDMSFSLPISVFVPGTAISHPSASGRSREAWKGKIRDIVSELLPKPHFAHAGPVSVTILMFNQYAGAADVDNASKTILDALSRFLIADDKQVRRLFVQSFEPDAVYEFDDPDAALITALAHEGDGVYIRVSADLFAPLYG